jgi:translation elongation factor EF-4
LTNSDKIIILQIKVSSGGVKRLGEELVVRNPASWPSNNDIEIAFEPIVKGTIICPSDQMGEIMGLITEYRLNLWSQNKIC